MIISKVFLGLSSAGKDAPGKLAARAMKYPNIFH